MGVRAELHERCWILHIRIANSPMSTVAMAEFRLTLIVRIGPHWLQIEIRVRVSCGDVTGPAMRYSDIEC